MIGEVSEACDNDLQKPIVTSVLIDAIGSEVYYNEKNNKIAIYNEEAKEYTYYK